jgi:hypothetical protein
VTALVCITVIVIFLLRKRSAKKTKEEKTSAPVYHDVADEKTEKQFESGQVFYPSEPIELETVVAELEAYPVADPPVEMGLSSPR